MAVVVRWLLFAGFRLFAVLLASLLLLSVVCFMSIVCISWKFGIPFHRLLASFRHLSGVSFCCGVRSLANLYFFSIVTIFFLPCFYFPAGWLLVCSSAASAASGVPCNQLVAMVCHFSSHDDDCTKQESEAKRRKEKKIDEKRRERRRQNKRKEKKRKEKKRKEK